MASKDHSNQPHVSDQATSGLDLKKEKDKKLALSKNGMGEFQVLQAHKPDEANREAVIAMRLADIPQKRIAKVLDINPQTLVKYYKRELEMAKDVADQLVLTKLMQGIKAGDPKLIQFYLKNKKNWNDKQEHIITHKVVRPKEDIEEELLALGVSPEKLKDI